MIFFLNYHIVNLASQVFYEISIFGKLACDTLYIVLAACGVLLATWTHVSYVHHGFSAQVNRLCHLLDVMM